MKKVFKAFKNLFGKKSSCPCDRGEVTCVEVTASTILLLQCVKFTTFDGK